MFRAKAFITQIAGKKDNFYIFCIIFVFVFVFKIQQHIIYIYKYTHTFFYYFHTNKSVCKMFFTVMYYI